jgi:hypothetical protein
MRLSRTAWLVLGIGVFVIAFASLYVVYSGQSREGRQLNNNLAAANARLPKVVAERENLESQLTEQQGALASAESALDVAMAKFPKSVESVDYDEVLFKIADGCDLEVSSLKAEEPSDVKIKGEAGEITYAVTAFTIEVKAAGAKPITLEQFETYIDETVDNILDFINEVVTGEHFTTATVDSVSMKNLEPPVDADELESAPKPSATIQLSIYSYKGE